MASNLKHDNIVSYKYFITEYEEDKGTHIIHNLMEYCEGQNLNNFIYNNKAINDMKLLKTIAV